MDRDTPSSPSIGHATLIDVAARARVSVATASRALSTGKVSKKNLEKVSKAAELLGYVPNTTARNLQSTRTMTMGLVYHHMAGSISFELLDALTATVEDQGYSLFVSSARGQDDRFDMLVKRFLERRVDALFCVHPTGAGDELRRFERTATPVLALFSHSGGYGRVPLLSGTLSKASKEALGRLRELGHEKICLVMAERRMSAMTAFRATATRQKMPMECYGPTEGPFDATAFISDLMARRSRPTAIVALYPDAVAIMEACSDLKISIPKEISLISIGDHGAYPAMGTRSLSAIRTNPAMLGRAAGGLMLEWLNGKAPPAENTIDIASWAERATTGPAPKKK